MPAPKIIGPKVVGPSLGPLVCTSRDLRASLDAMPAASRRLARTAGAALAVASLLIAFASSAQTAAYGPQSESGGLLAWLFALFAGAAVLGVFLVVLTLVWSPSGRPGSHPPGTRQDR